MDPTGALVVLVLGVVLGAFVLVAVGVWVAAVVAWTAIWLALKLVTTVVFLPPALVLSECCDCQGPKRGVFVVLKLKWNCFPSSKGEDGAIWEETIPEQSASARVDSLRAVQSSSEQADTATAATMLPSWASPPVERDVEQGIPERDPVGCPSSTPPDMDIADSVLDEPAPPSYESVHDSEEPPPEYEPIDSGRHVWG